VTFSLSSVRDVFLVLVQMDLRHLREYAELGEQHLLDEKDDFQKEVDDAASSISEEDKQDYYDFRSDDYWKLADVFPNILRTSLFVTTYSLFEHRLNRLCQDYQRERGLPLSVTDLTGSGIARAQAYIKKVLSIKFPDNLAEWKSMLLFNKMRNAFVHNEGILKSEEGGAPLGAVRK